MLNTCRHCASPLYLDFLDLGHAPASNAYLSANELSEPELYFPLRLKACEKCRLVQTEDYAQAEQLFTKDYAYFSSTSKTWLDHAKNYCKMIQDRFELNSSSQVLEIASNDGYLLKNFVEAGIPCLGIEPTASTAAAALKAGVDTKQIFFGSQSAKDVPKADLIIGNNVYAHVPDINDFTTGLATALKPEGVVTLEFPHLMRMVENNQFDTAYHEHFSYLSLITTKHIMAQAGMRIFDVEELPTHGGSLRVYACKVAAAHEQNENVKKILAKELSRGMNTDQFYGDFQRRANNIKNHFLQFLLETKTQNHTVVGYGAAAKGNTLINYAGVKPDLLPVIYDSAKSKVGKFMPGSHIPIHDPVELRTTTPDYVIIFPWNISTEIKTQLTWLAERGSKFITFVPDLREL